MTTDKTQTEALAAAVHQAYLDTCARLGWSVKPENAVPYEALSDDSKELDRASVRAVLTALTNTQAEGERREKWRIIDGVLLSAPAFSGFGDYMLPEMSPQEICDLLNDALESAASRGDRAEEALLNVRRFLDYVDLIGTGGRDEQVIRDEQELASLIEEIDDFEREKGGG